MELNRIKKNQLHLNLFMSSHEVAVGKNTLGVYALRLDVANSYTRDFMNIIARVSDPTKFPQTLTLN